MLVSIVVPAFNEERLLGNSLRSIHQALPAFSELGWQTEIIVCDNNSTDRTAEIARTAGARVVFEPENQIARARNTGARVARGDWLIFVDADSHPTQALFSDVARTIQGGRVAAGGSTLILDTPYFVARMAGRFWNLISRSLKLLAGAFIFCRADLFRQVGGFDESLFASEEIDLSRRLRKAARKEGKKLTILYRHPMVTSDRKVHLYKIREHLWVIAKAVLTGSKSLRNRDHCHTWYDGRR